MTLKETLRDSNGLRSRPSDVVDKISTTKEIIKHEMTIKHGFTP